MSRWPLIVMIAGCSSSPSTTCTQVAGVMAESMRVHGSKLSTDKLEPILLDRCKADDWSPEARACLVKARSSDPLAACTEALGEDAVPLSLAIAGALRRYAIDVAVPPPAPLPAGSLALEVSATAVVVTGKPKTDAELDALFATAAKTDAGTQVILRADKDVPYARIVAIMNRAKAAGVTRIAFATAAR